MPDAAAATELVSQPKHKAALCQALAAATGLDPGYDAFLASDAEPNREAIARWRAHLRER